MRIEGTAHMIKPMFNFFDQMSSADDASSDNIIVPIQVFRTTVQGEIETPLRRPEIYRASESIVYQ